MNYSKIKSIKKIPARTTYELSIKDTHCFFVNGMLKHNCRCHAHVDMDARTVTFISRQGKKFTTLNNLTEPVLNFMTDEGLGLTGLRASLVSSYPKPWLSWLASAVT